VEAADAQLETAAAIAAIRLLILTGCRVGEILTLQWSEVDFEQRCLRLADSKTGRKTVYLNTAALQVLAGIERADDNPYVIEGSKPGNHLVGLTRTWFRIRRRAGLAEVRLHDLRHTYASIGAGMGLSLPIIGKLLGHTQPVTTQRYAHLAADPMRQAAERIGATIEAALAGRPKAAVVEIGRN
jgi:integrase